MNRDLAAYRIRELVESGDLNAALHIADDFHYHIATLAVDGSIIIGIQATFVQEGEGLARRPKTWDPIEAALLWVANQLQPEDKE
jgi:hypothetical protein